VKIGRYLYEKSKNNIFGRILSFLREFKVTRVTSYFPLSLGEVLSDKTHGGPFGPHFLHYLF